MSAGQPVYYGDVVYITCLAQAYSGWLSGVASPFGGTNQGDCSSSDLPSSLCPTKPCAC